MAITDGYVIMQGGYYRAEDMSGPYAIGSDGSVALIGSDSGGGGGGQTDGLTDAQLRASPVPVTGGGLTDDQLRASPVPVTGGLTDAQLRAAAIEITPAMGSGGNIAVAVTETATALPSHACRKITISNSSAADVSVIQDGAPFVVIAKSHFTFFGVSNTSDLELQSETDANVSVRWEN